mgnify:CR=1 FL=1
MMLEASVVPAGVQCDPQDCAALADQYAAGFHKDPLIGAPTVGVIKDGLLAFASIVPVAAVTHTLATKP